MAAALAGATGLGPRWPDLAWWPAAGAVVAVAAVAGARAVVGATLSSLLAPPLRTWLADQDCYGGGQASLGAGCGRGGNLCRLAYPRQPVWWLG